MASHDTPRCGLLSVIASADEHLCRYVGRPAIVESRLSLLPDGRVAYSLQ